MRQFVGAVLCGLFVSSAFAVPAVAGERKTQDPNRMVCEKQEVLGSRLATKRVCKTAAEWEAERAASRQVIDRSQTQRGTSGSGGG